MLLPKFKDQLYLYLNNIIGWKTNRKIVVIESDDWGSIRMPSKEVYERLIKKGIRVDKDPYCRFDTIATEDDLNSLFDLLSSFRDIHGMHPVITANAVMTNPDFERIKEGGFGKYYYEPFTKTFTKYPGSEGAFELWKKGIDKGLFYPQFHGRDHLNIHKWMSYLQSGNKEVLFGFENNLFCLSEVTTPSIKGGFVAAFSNNDLQVTKTYDEIISDGIEIFKNHFTFSPLSFIAPNYAWSDEVAESTARQGIKYLQGNFAQYNTKTKHASYNYLGKRNKYGQIYLTRNCFFEPSLDPNQDWLASCLKEIEMAFRFKRPAIISTHRLNYTGRIDKKNKSTNLKQFALLLKKITSTWTDVEFITSDSLGKLVT